MVTSVSYGKQALTHFYKMGQKLTYLPILSHLYLHNSIFGFFFQFPIYENRILFSISYLQKLHKCGYAKEAGAQAICLLIVHGPSDGQGAFFTLVRIA